MIKKPSLQLATPAEFIKAIAATVSYEVRMQYWREALIELEPKEIVGLMKNVRSENTTLSYAGDAFYAAAESCKDLLPIQRISEIIALLLHEDMQYAASQLAEILKRRRMSTALADIPVRAVGETKTRVDELLSTVPGFDKKGDREYMRKNVALLLRQDSPVARKIANLPPAALQKLDQIGNMAGRSLADFGRLPPQSWELVQDCISPETPRDRCDAAVKALRLELEQDLSA